MRLGYYLNHICIRSLLKGDYSLHCTLTEMHIRKLVRQNPTADDIMMFCFVDCAEICIGQPWRFPITGCDKLVTFLSMYSRFVLYC